MKNTIQFSQPCIFDNCFHVRVLQAIQGEVLGEEEDLSGDEDDDYVDSDDSGDK